MAYHIPPKDFAFLFFVEKVLQKDDQKMRSKVLDRKVI